MRARLSVCVCVYVRMYALLIFKNSIIGIKHTNKLVNKYAKWRSENLSEKLQQTSGCPHEWFDSLASEETSGDKTFMCMFVHAFPFDPPRHQAARSCGSVLRPRDATRGILVSFGHLEQDKSKVDTVYTPTRNRTRSHSRERDCVDLPSLSAFH